MKHVLTGRSRVREQKRWFAQSMLVMQVEVRVTGTETDWVGGARVLDYTEWRDAQITDLAVFDIAKLK